MSASKSLLQETLKAQRSDLIVDEANCDDGVLSYNNIKDWVAIEVLSCTLNLLLSSTCVTIHY